MRRGFAVAEDADPEAEQHVVGRRRAVLAQQVRDRRPVVVGDRRPRSPRRSRSRRASCVARSSSESTTRPATATTAVTRPGTLRASGGLAREIDGRQTARNLAVTRLFGLRGRLRGRGSRRPAGRRPCRRRRRCRSCGRSPRRRGRSTASARSRAGPPAASSRPKTRVAADLVEVDARLLLDAVHEDLERAADARPAGRPDSAVPRAIRCQPRAQDRVCHTRHDPRRACDGGCRVRGQRRIPARRGPFAERAPHPRRVHLRLDLHRHHLPRSSRAR